MKSIDSAIQTSKQMVAESTAARIDKEHAQVLEAIKAEFGISNFAKESESVKNAIRSLVLEMWDPKSGLTEKGKKAICEAAVSDIITKDSTKKQVVKYIERAMKSACRSFAAGNFSKSKLMKAYADVKDNVKHSGNKEVSVDDINAIYCKCFLLACKSEFKLAHLCVC